MIEPEILVSILSFVFNKDLFCDIDKGGLTMIQIRMFSVTLWEGDNDNVSGKGITTTVPAWCISAHASFVFKIDRQKTNVY